MTRSEFKTIKTPDGVVLHVYKEPGKNSVPHSIDGPAIKYPKAMKKADEYFIYGIKYSKSKWEEMKETTKVTYMPIDPNLG
jgi:hypothetical protein